MAPCSPARVVGLTAQALLGLALALTNAAARAATPIILAGTMGRQR